MELLPSGLGFRVQGLGPGGPSEWVNNQHNWGYHMAIRMRLESKHTS